MKLLSIIISNRNDTVMLSVTINSCIEELRELGLENCEIIICDNSDQSIYDVLPSCLPMKYVKEGLLKIVRQDYACLFTAREEAARIATGEYICCVDSHMLIGKGMFDDLIDFMEEHQDDETLGFAHAPLRWAYHHEARAVHDRDISKNELGDWNRSYDQARTITWKGMPWICRREWFLDSDKGLNGYGALAQHRISWGGGDMHIGTKPWLLGFKNWAVPTSPAIHIGPFPRLNTKDNPVDASGEFNGYKYRLYGSSGNFPHAFGFLVSCYVLGGEPMMKRNEKAITNRFGKYIKVASWWRKAIKLGSDERNWLSDRQDINFEQFIERRPWDA